MFYIQIVFYFIGFHLIIGTPQINLYHTDWVDKIMSDNNITLQHNCLRISDDILFDLSRQEIVSYCMSELPSKFNIIEDIDSNFKFTFDELSKENITSQDLYLWSTPMDIIERYQFYLYQLTTVNNLSLAQQVFYNCTMPRFGPKCQYQLYYHQPSHVSLYNIIERFYREYMHQATSLTCYTYLQCNRGSFSICLDWSEICDGKIDCLNDAVDEEHCWQLETNECKDNEYRCANGQCVPKEFFRKDLSRVVCMDSSDRHDAYSEYVKYTCRTNVPSLECDDVQCDFLHLTSSCVADRITLLVKRMFSIKDNSVSENCWSALKCSFGVPQSENSFCNQLCVGDICAQIINLTCPQMLYFPNVPVFFNQIYFAFKKNDFKNSITTDIGLLYICYNHSYYDYFFNRSSNILLFNNTKCFLHNTISYPSNWSTLWRTIYVSVNLRRLYKELNKYSLIFNYIVAAKYNATNIYQCINSSKCISIYRLMDNRYDCPFMDDENFSEITENSILMEKLKKIYFKCEVPDKFINPLLVNNLVCNCEQRNDVCDDEQPYLLDIQKNISFQTICDGFIELTPVFIDGQNETDETECNKWECDNIYTHCNRIWNCPNGADEINCPSNSILNCSLNDHICVSLQNKLICLPIEKANDGTIDCLGAQDEPMLCRSKTSIDSANTNFRCMNQSIQTCVHPFQLCDGYSNCEYGDDEKFCTTDVTVSRNNGVCEYYYLSTIEHHLCRNTDLTDKQARVHFQIPTNNDFVKHIVQDVEKPIDSSLSLLQSSYQYQPRCHRGLDLIVWLNNKNNYTITCLCPPSFYGAQCQYQNQRISLIIQFQALSDFWETVFAIIISLIDDSDRRIIHSYEQITYLWIRAERYCLTRYYIYLLYSSQPKDPAKNYSIHIDIYEKESLNYRGSLLFPVNFSFLPVHRLPLLVTIPRNDNIKTQNCPKGQCIHGKCIKYSNNSEKNSFCQCDEGWSGKYCTIKHRCECANDSLCIGISANNRSICVCRLNKFGSQCLLSHTICQNDDNSTCYHNGKCIPHGDDYIKLNQKFTCICLEGFRGDQCELVDRRLTLSFNKDIILSQSIFVHFIHSEYPQILKRSTTFRTIPIRQDSIIIHWQQPFELVFTELSDKTYYLTYIEQTYYAPSVINKTFNAFDRCPHISELFNKTYLQWKLLRRIKYYHIPCQNQSLNLSCFYDEVHLCLCYDFNQKRLANCFNFDHNMKFNCLGESECEGTAQCFQDDQFCPKRSICICPSCYYGRRCQFTTSGFGLSLDAILGYHIIPNISLSDQSPIVQFSFALTIIFSIAGFLDGILCLITFKSKSVREVGCGLYLLSLSIAALCTIVMFILKFLILLLIQMTIISNKSFLEIQCISFDFILQICFNMTQWLNACIAIERAFTAIKASYFDKKKSKQTARFVIIFVFIIVTSTYIHEPISRHTIEEENDAKEKRIWCIVRYSFGLQLYNSLIHISHFCCSFMINLLSAIILITKTSHRQANIYKQRTYQEILRGNFQEHKHLLIAPIVLIILALPRIIIAFVSKCMKSANESWVFLIAYFISFIPSMLNFIIFIVPSKFYKKEFQKSLVEIQTNIRRFLHFRSSI